MLLDAAGPAGLEGITVWLAELAQTALDVVLIIDAADRLQPASREAQAYEQRNAPPNLRTVIAARPDCDLGIDDLIAYGQCVIVGPAVLRFRLNETIELVQARFGAKVDYDTAARLHQLMEGWPLGLQLAMTVIERGADARADVAGMAALGGELRGHVPGLLLANLDEADRRFLTLSSCLDNLHPDLCRTVVQAEDGAERLLRLARDTPVFDAAEHGEWQRMHMLVRDMLRQTFSELPEALRATTHARAAEWLAGHGLPEQAARHALLAGQQEKAYELTERSLYESIMAHGRQAVVLEWLNELPAEELDRRPRLLMAVAWTLAISERHDEAG
ncbi:MAG TPA: LuxR family transcriptional regulator, partial [Ramlibacter sp.]